MRTDEPDRPVLSDEERRFVERMDSAYRPRPMDPVRRAALEARVRERIDRPRWRSALVPAFAAATAAALAWVVLPLASDEPAAESGGASRELAGRAEVGAWEQRLFHGDLTAADLDDEDELLPPDYAAIESLFFDG